MSSECNPETDIDGPRATGTNDNTYVDNLNSNSDNNNDKSENGDIRSAQKQCEIQKISDQVRDKAVKTEEEMAGHTPELGVKYDAKFDLVNILMIGTTASGKTKMTRDLIRGFFKNLTRVYCISTIKMSKEVLIDDNKNFPSHMQVRHYRIITVKDLNNVINTIKGLCEMDQSIDKNVRSVIIFDDVISVANKCTAYGTFLTYCRNYNTSTINIFQAVVSQSTAWKVLVSNCPILIMFQLGFTGTEAARILNTVISMRGATTHSQSWLNRLYIDIVVTNSNYGHLLIDVRPVKAFNVASVRTDITNIFYQRCFAGNPLDEKEYRQFVSKRYKGSMMRIKSLEEFISPDQQTVKQVDSNTYIDNSSRKIVAKRKLKTREAYPAEEDKKVANSSTYPVSQPENEQLRQTTTELSTRKRKSSNKSYLPDCRCQAIKRTSSTVKVSKPSDNESEATLDSENSGTASNCSDDGSYGQQKTTRSAKQRRLSSRRATPSKRYAREIRGREWSGRNKKNEKLKKKANAPINRGK